MGLRGTNMKQRTNNNAHERASRLPSADLVFSPSLACGRGRSPTPVSHDHRQYQPMTGSSLSEKGMMIEGDQEKKKRPSVVEEDFGTGGILGLASSGRSEEPTCKHNPS
jgi:hypothetical protein